MANWFSIVSQDISKIPDAILHYETELERASAEVKLHGNLEKQSASMPGVVEERFRQLQEVEGILKHLEIQHRRLRTKHWHITNIVKLRVAGMEDANL